jgi:microcystin-dependent protein
MAEPFVGEIRMVGFTFAPVGWALCNGQTLSIAQNEVLFTLIGTTYGGDGVQTFALPDLRGRMPVHQGADGSGNSYVAGQQGGVEAVTLTANQMPAHTHATVDTNRGTLLSPTGAIWAGSGQSAYSTSAPGAQLNPASVSAAGQNQPHPNMPPFLAITFIISLLGIFPSRD